MDTKNVIIIGAGLSGLTCSVKLAENGNHVHLFSPSPSERSQSVMAMGGINAALKILQRDPLILHRQESYIGILNSFYHFH